ncbi:unnamed protein product, partial [Effrenium voratum]
DGLFRSLGENFEQEFPSAAAGLKEGLKITDQTGQHGGVIALAAKYVNRMKKEGILTMQKQEETAEKQTVASSLNFPNPQRQYDYYMGTITILLALSAPEFVKSVRVRCLGGLVGSIQHPDYRKSYEESMAKAVIKACVNEKQMKAKEEALKEEKIKIEEQQKDCAEVLKELRSLL